MVKVKYYFINKLNYVCLFISKVIIYNVVMSDNILMNGLIFRLVELNKKGFFKIEMVRVVGVSK